MVASHRQPVASRRSRSSSTSLRRCAARARNCGPMRISAGPGDASRARSAVDRQASCSGCAAPGSDALSTIATGRPGGLPAASSVCAMRCGFTDAHVDRAGVGRGEAVRPVLVGSLVADARRGERDAARACRVASATCASSAAAASAAVMPGTTSHAMPAASSAAISSCARPNSIGSPPLRRTTTRCARAASTSRLLMNRCAVECLPQRLPTAIFCARCGERDRLRMHQRVVEHDVGLGEQARGAQRQQVRRARAGADEVDGARSSDHPRGDGAVGRFVDQDEAAGRADCRRSGRRTIGCASESVAWPMSFIASASGAGSRACVVDVPQVIEARRRARAPRASCGAARTCGGDRAGARRASTASASMRCTASGALGGVRPACRRARCRSRRRASSVTASCSCARWQRAVERANLAHRRRASGRQHGRPRRRPRSSRLRRGRDSRGRRSPVGPRHELHRKAERRVRRAAVDGASVSSSSQQRRARRTRPGARRARRPCRRRAPTSARSARRIVDAGALRELAEVGDDARERRPRGSRRDPSC